MSFPFFSVMDFNFMQLHLKRLSWREYLRKENPVIAALLCRMDYSEEERQQLKKEFFRMILKLELDEARAEFLTTFMDNYINLTTEEDALKEDLEKELPDEVRKLEELMTSWERRGMEKGIEEGIEKGETSALRSVIISQAKQKFDSLDKGTEEKINNISDKDKLKRIASKLIHLESEKKLLEVLEE